MSTTLLYSQQTAVLTTKDDINNSVHNKLAHSITMRTTTITATTVETDDDGVDSMHNGLLPIQNKEENANHDMNCNTVPPSDDSSGPTASNGELVTITKKKSSPTRLASFRRSISSSFSISSRKHQARTITRKSSYLSSRKSSTLSSLSSQHITLSDGEDNTISQIDEHTQKCAVEAAKSKKKYFRSTLPKSLLKVYDSRDCVASFQRDEVR